MCPINLATGWGSVGLGPDLTGHFELFVHLAYILVVSCDTLMGAPARARCHCTEVQDVRWIHYKRCSESNGWKTFNLTYVHCWAGWCYIAFTKAVGSTPV